MLCLEVPGAEKMMEPSFEKLLAHLAEAQIDFILVGGLAVALNGFVRLTEGVDILISTEPENITRFLSAMSNFGEGHGSTFLPEDFDDSFGALRLIEESEQSQLDIFTQMDGKNYADWIAHTNSFSLNGREIRYASRSMLIQFKSSSVREKDQIDVIALRKLEEEEATPPES